MTDYLSCKFTESPEFVNTFDEAPLWSASFGLLMLKHLQLRPDITLLDVGSGAGFPLLEVAQRLGSSSKCYGIDPWVNANMRARQKIANYGISNVDIIDGSADDLPFEDGRFDVITSNLGVNNFEDPARVLKECKRVLKPGGKIAITTNLNGHWSQFYRVFEDTLREMNKDTLVTALHKEQEHRGTLESISTLFTDSGFTVHRHYEEQFEMSFVDGSVFLNHYFVKLGWLGGWLALVPQEEHQTVFRRLEKNLNTLAQNNNGLTLAVPMAYIEARK